MSNENMRDQDQQLTEQSDWQLFTAWANGCRRSGNTLIERHIESVQRFFRSKVRHEYVEDLVQQTFMSAFEAHARFRGEAPFKSYLLRIAHFRLLRHYRRTARAREVDFDIANARDLGTTPSGRLNRAREQRRLAAALRELPLEHQIVLELSYWEGMSGADVAFVLGLTLNTAYSRLHRAKQALRTALQRQAPLASEGADDGALLETWVRPLRDSCAR
jgi:RNA polymerase sigma factor (sigma-70 family)